MGKISLPCTSDKVCLATGSTQDPQRGTEALALRAYNRLDILQIPPLMNLLAEGIDHPQEQVTLPDETSGQELHHTREASDAGTSSHEYFMPQASV